MRRRALTRTESLETPNSHLGLQLCCGVERGGFSAVAKSRKPETLLLAQSKQASWALKQEVKQHNTDCKNYKW